MARADVFLSRRGGWLNQCAGERPKCQVDDLGAVREALLDLVGAAGGLEYSREALRRVMVLDQEGFAECIRASSSGPNTPGVAGSWGGPSTPAVYYEFGNAVAWTRSVKDRFKERLLPAVLQDATLHKRIKVVRNRTAGQALEQARMRAKWPLHHFTPPYEGACATVRGGRLIYLVPAEIVETGDKAKNLTATTDVESVVESYWEAVCVFMDSLLDVFYG